MQNQGGPPIYQQGTAVQAHLPADALRVLQARPTAVVEDPAPAIPSV
jgi:hypothetical protein